MSSENSKQDNLKSSDMQLVNDLNAALPKEKHRGQFWIVILFFVFLVVCIF